MSHKKWYDEIIKSTALRARDLVDESFKEQHRRFYDYYHELSKFNSRSTVKVSVQLARAISFNAGLLLN